MRELTAICTLALAGTVATGCFSSFSLLGQSQLRAREVEILSENIYVNEEHVPAQTVIRPRQQQIVVSFRGNVEIRTSREFEPILENPACLVFLPLCLAAQQARVLVPYDTKTEHCEGSPELAIERRSSYRVRIITPVDAFPVLEARMATAPYTEIQQELECDA
jgi:hypothetical protein